MLTKSDLEQIKKYLALYGKKDSQLPSLDNYTPDKSHTYINAGDYLAIVQDGINKIVTLKNLEKSFLDTFTHDPDYAGIIDAVPAQDSDNFVKSGGVYSAIHEHVIPTKQIEDNAVTTPKIKDGNVTNSKLADDNVSWNKLNHDVQTRITTHEYGPSLSTEYGDSDLVGITQKTISEFKTDYDNLKDLVYEINYQPSFVVNHTVVFKDISTLVTATASLKFNGTSVVDFTATTPEGWTEGTTSGTTRTFTKNVNTTQTVTTTISKDNYSITKSANIVAVDHIYYGAGATDAILNTSSMIAWDNPLISPSFIITSLHTAQNNYIYFEVPNSMNITKVLIWDNHSLPTEISFSLVATSREGYKAYKSNSSRAEGTHNYKVEGN